jgi:hypothetical protein
MSRLYSSPESYAVAVCHLTGSGARLRSAPNHDAVHHSCRRVRQQSRSTKDAFPNRRHSLAGRTKNISLPKPPQQPRGTKPRLRKSCLSKHRVTASRDGFLRKSSSAMGFRSLCGREQHSFNYCARLDLRFGTFHSAGSRFENSGVHPLLRGQQPWTDVVSGT